MSSKKTPTGGGGKGGGGGQQASLFSFFARKPTTQQSSSSSQSTPKAAAAAGPSAPASSSQGSSAAAATPSPATTAGGAAGRAPSSAGRKPQQYGQEVVGRRIAVWWPEDEEFYEGKVTGFDAGKGKHTVTYDDGEVEAIDLAVETVQWPGQEDAAAAAGDGGAAGGNGKKRRVVQEEDEESEAEFDFGDGGGGGKTPASSSAVAAQQSAGGRQSVQAKGQGGSASGDGGAGKRARLGAPFAAFQAATAGMSSNDDDDDDEDYSGEGEDEESESDASSRGGGRAKAAAATKKKGASSSKGKGTPASARGAGGSSSAATTPTARLFSPATPHSAAASSAGKGKKFKAAFSDDDASVGSAAASGPPRADGVLDAGKHTHHSLKWLWPPERRDAEKRKPEDPLYNPRTLFVPPSFLQRETPAMKQWWEFKAQNFDTILFFKVGKFYEIFHMDADVAVTELDLIYMKGDKAHSGFPEIAYGKFAAQLVEKGYRVARVEQTETPEGMKEHNRTCGKGQKRTVVSRELCSVLSKGTRTICYLDEAQLLEGGGGDGGALLMAIKEEVLLPTPVAEAGEAEAEPRVFYGVCMVDPTTGAFHMGQFEDGPQRWRLRTLLSQFSPSEVLLERGVASGALEQMVRFCAPGALVEFLRPGEEFWGPRRTFRELKRAGYFPRASKKGDGAGDEDARTRVEKEDVPVPVDEQGVPKGISRWPPILRYVASAAGLDKEAAAGSPPPNAQLALTALGGVSWQLRRSMIDMDLLSMQTFLPYAPPDVEDTPKGQQGAQGEGSAGAAMELDGGDAFFSAAPAVAAPMDVDDEEDGAAGPAAAAAQPPAPREPPLVLDGTTLANLEIFCNSYDRTAKGSLWEHINRCQTAFGARRLRDMLCRPSQSPATINSRLDAVEELMGELSPEADGIRTLLKRMPDVERQLARHHALGSVHRSEDHPDARAVMYETGRYNERKIRDFLSALEGLRTAAKVKNVLADAATPPTSRLLKGILDTFPDLGPKLQFFSDAFDPAQAKRDGIIKPRPGVDPQYDDAKAAIAGVKAELDAYLKEQRKRLGSNEISYWGSKDKDRYQLEVPESVLKRGQPADFEAKSSKKGWRRFHTPEIRRMVEELCEAEAQLAEAERDEMRRLFHKFDSSRDIWQRAVQNVSLLDALLALADVSSGPGYCRPAIVEPASAPDGPFISIRGGRHPCLEAKAGGNFIPNDLDLGANTRTQRVMLLSGPNMGGKSTLLRQTCVLAILAQVGCFVPADSCELTPVDRIFTRVGASDRILQGQSTFFVELAETANILSHATARSLVILDELGRGTSTFDGTAIAHAVVKWLAEEARCRALFATHYHSLVETWKGHPSVCFGHMACLVHTEGEQRVTFLYKLADGAAPKSYGINVARLARLPQEVLDLAQEKSRQFEAFMDGRGPTEGEGGVDRRLALGAEVLALLMEEGGGGDGGGSKEALVEKARQLWVQGNL